MCLNKTYSEVHIGKHLSDVYPIQNGLKQGNALLSLLFQLSFKAHHKKGLRQSGGNGTHQLVVCA